MGMWQDGLGQGKREYRRLQRKFSWVPRTVYGRKCLLPGQGNNRGRLPHSGYLL